MKKTLMYILVGIAVLIAVLGGYSVYHFSLGPSLKNSPKNNKSQPLADSMQTIQILPVSSASKVNVPTSSVQASSSGLQSNVSSGINGSASSLVSPKTGHTEESPQATSPQNSAQSPGVLGGVVNTLQGGGPLNINLGLGL